jgi:hypothetical protein
MSQNISANAPEELYDIKPLLEIPDQSYTLFLALIGFGVLLLSAILYFAVKKYLEYRKKNLAKEYLAALHAIDWEDSKQSAYKATHYARLLATDERRKELFEQLEPLLEQYKYKKEVQAVDAKTLQQFSLFVQVADESV